MLLTQLICGFALINFLNKSDYATFTIVMALQGTAIILVDMGITQSLTALIGKGIKDRGFVGRYLVACRQLRNYMLVAGSAVLLVIIYYAAPRFEWSFSLSLFLWICLCLTLLFRSVGAVYKPVFLLKQNLVHLYKVDAFAGVSRLLLILAAFTFGFLSASVAILLGVIQAAISGIGLWQLSRKNVEYPDSGTDLSAERKEIISQTLPRAPGYAFFAFEGQITIFIITLLGTTMNVAELGALGRLAMLFLIFNRMGSNLVGPYMSKLDSHQVLSKTMFFTLITTVFFIAVAGLSYVFPEPLLLLLGNGYQHLRLEVFLVVLAASIRSIDVIIYSICLSRKYVYSWYSLVDILPVVIVMILGFALMDLSQLTNVLYYSVAIAVIRLLSKIFIACVGLSREGAKAEVNV